MKKKVLLIEDDSFILDIVSMILGDEGYKVLSSELVPIHRIKNLQPDVILLDEWMN